MSRGYLQRSLTNPFAFRVFRRGCRFIAALHRPRKLYQLLCSAHNICWRGLPHRVSAPADAQRTALLSGSAGSWDLAARFHRLLLSPFPLCQCPSSSVLATPAPTTTTTTPLTPIYASGPHAQLPRSLQSLSDQSNVRREERPSARNTSSFGRMRRRSAPNLRSTTHIQRRYQESAGTSMLTNRSPL